MYRDGDPRAGDEQLAAVVRVRHPRNFVAGVRAGGCQVLRSRQPTVLFMYGRAS
jgi:hypothetical protein